MKKFLPLLGVLAGLSVQAQEATEAKKDYGKIFGGFESNAQWYLNDKERNIAHPEDPIRSNNYLLLNYEYKNWSAGIQGEAYEPNALLNYNPGFKGTNVGIWYAAYKTKKVEITGGYFYDQFGSGMILRAWEDRTLGINTALRGGRILYRPTDDIRLTALYGRQRSGFNVSEGDIFGFDSDFNLSRLFKFEKSDLSFGFSYVGRYQKTDLPNPVFDELTNAFSGRFNFIHDAFYISGEYDYKSEDAIFDAQNQISNDFVKPGNAVLVNFGYSKKGLGIDATLRRTENMLFLSERQPTVANSSSTSLNYNDKVLSFIPALTKQHHSNLANIYVYQAQARADFSIDPTLLKAGETGAQFDVFYNFDKGTALGGKYGTEIAVNYSSWYNLPGQYRYIPADYHTDFFGLGKNYFTDFNVELKKQFSEQWRSALYYVRQYTDRRWQGTGSDVVNTNIVDAEVTYNFTATRSLRVEGEHMWADADKKNWAGATIEFSFNDKFSCYVWDIYNYGNDLGAQQTHYYNVGGAYRQNAWRLALNYGRQRGGLVCVGGVCRVVPESTGLTLSLSTAF